jgi:hypothetical protein
MVPNRFYTGVGMQIPNLNFPIVASGYSYGTAVNNLSSRWRANVAHEHTDLDQLIEIHDKKIFIQDTKHDSCAVRRYGKAGDLSTLRVRLGNWPTVF